MIGAILVIVVLVAVVLVMASGVWVAIALFTAIRTIKPPADATPDGRGRRPLAEDPSTPEN